MKDRKLMLRVAIKLMTIIAAGSVVYVLLLALIGRDDSVKDEIVSIDVSTIKPGEVKFFNVFNRRLLVLYRTAEMLNDLDKANDTLLKHAPSKKAAKNPLIKYRSYAAKYFVAYAYDPFYGCEIKLSNNVFVPVCVDVKYDLSGRVYQSRRAEEDLIVPSHEIKSQAMITIYKSRFKE